MAIHSELLIIQGVLLERCVSTRYSDPIGGAGVVLCVEDRALLASSHINSRPKMKCLYNNLAPNVTLVMFSIAIPRSIQGLTVERFLGIGEILGLQVVVP